MIENNGANKVSGNEFAVTYTIDYVHRVVVGVNAPDLATAIAYASDAFDAGTLWDDTESMPLLYDDYEEVANETLKFTAEAVATFPEPDASVNELKRREYAFHGCRELLAGSDRALDFARKALPHRAPTANTFECARCGRVYDDASECWSDDCPTSVAGRRHAAIRIGSTLPPKA